MNLSTKTLISGILLSLSSQVLAASGAVNVNTASAQKLAMDLKNINNRQASAIVAYRQKHGPFLNLQELLFVKGVGRSQIGPNYNEMTIGKVNGSERKPKQGV